MRIRFMAASALALALAGCASLGGISILPPTFAIDGQQTSELRLLGPSVQRPLGGASVRLYARVENPNPVGITLTRLAGTLRLEGNEAADADFPLGLPLTAGGSAIVPLEIAVDFSNLPGLADVLSRAVTRGNVGYSLDGTVGVDAGLLGQPTFGPMTLLTGTLQTPR